MYMTTLNILRSAITKIREANNGMVPFALKFRWLTDVANALAYMHRNNSVHKDIKAKNILLDGNLTAKLADFELATRGDSSQETQQFVKKYGEEHNPMMAGTLTHMAPETIKDTGLLLRPNPQYDVYSFGTVLNFVKYFKRNIDNFINT